MRMGERFPHVKRAKRVFRDLAPEHLARDARCTRCAERTFAQILDHRKRMLWRRWGRNCWK
jgi:hypothetical protein